MKAQALLFMVTLIGLAASVPVHACSPVWGQCGGLNWPGPTCCLGTSFCTMKNDWYSQCFPRGKLPYPLVDYTFDKDTSEFGRGIVVNNGPSLFNGQVLGDVTLGTGWRSQFAAQFDGQTSVIAVDKSENFGPLLAGGFTLEADIFRESINGEDGILGKNYGGDQFRLTWYGSTLTFMVFPEVLGSGCQSGFVQVQYTPPDDSYLNEWKYVKAVYAVYPGGSHLLLDFAGQVTSQTFNGCKGMATGGIPIHIGNTNGQTNWADSMARSTTSRSSLHPRFQQTLFSDRSQ